MPQIHLDHTNARHNYTQPSHLSDTATPHDDSFKALRGRPSASSVYRPDVTMGIPMTSENQMYPAPPNTRVQTSMVAQSTTFVSPIYTIRIQYTIFDAIEHLQISATGTLPFDILWKPLG